MRCDDVIARLSAYADGEISWYRSRRIGRHLEGCSSCRDHLAGLQEVDRILEELPMPPVPEGLAARVVAEAIRRAPSVKRLSTIGRLSEWFIPALGAMSTRVRLAACGTVLAAIFAGVFAAERVSPTDSRHAVVVATRELDGLEWFGSAPPASVTAAYLASVSTSSPTEGDAQ
ncbi:MAG: zf-HC2 domain-containing protein [bacterium]|jgi:anti-sigma factor (TIGR02949 family)